MSNFLISAMYILPEESLNRCNFKLIIHQSKYFEKYIDLKLNVTKQIEEGYVEAEQFYSNFLEDGYAFNKEDVYISYELDSDDFGLLTGYVEDILQEDYSEWEVKLSNIVEGLTSYWSEEYEAYWSWYCNNFNGCEPNFSLSEVIENDVIVFSGASSFTDFCLEQIRELYYIPDNFPNYYISDRAISDYEKSIEYQKLADGRILVIVMNN